MSRADLTPATAAPEIPLPPLGLRTVISFLLFIHLFLLAVAIAGNFGALSGLERELVEKKGIREYLTLLHMNTGYGFAHVYGLSDDYDHELLLALDVPREFEATDAQIKEHKVHELVPSRLGPGIRRKRYLRLSDHLVPLVGEGEDPRAVILADSLAKGLVREAGDAARPKDGSEIRHRLVCREIQTQPFSAAELESVPAADRDPRAARWLTNIYQAVVVPTPDGWLVTKVVGRGDATRTRPVQNAAPSDKPTSPPAPLQPGVPPEDGLRPRPVAPLKTEN